MRTDYAVLSVTGIAETNLASVKARKKYNTVPATRLVGCRLGKKKVKM